MIGNVTTIGTMTGTEIGTAGGTTTTSTTAPAPTPVTTTLPIRRNRTVARRPAFGSKKDKPSVATVFGSPTPMSGPQGPQSREREPAMLKLLAAIGRGQPMAAF